MIWLIGVVVIPLIVLGLLFVAAADDIGQIIRLQIGFSRFLGDLWHVFLILIIGILAELVCLFELFTHFF